MHIPKYTNEENLYYENLLKKVSKEISLPETITDRWLCVDERSRMLWYFVSKELKNSPESYLRFKENLNSWKNNKEDFYWYKKWIVIVKEIDDNKSFDILYENSERMQQLRSRSPLGKSVILDEKLRYKIITFINNRIK